MFRDVSSFVGHHFEAFGPRRLGRTPGEETLKIEKKSLAEGNTMPSTCFI